MSESLTNEELDWLEKELKPDHDLEQWLIFVGKLWEENASALISMARRALSAEERLEKAVEALRLLHDFQNGCPLPSYEKHWNEAMEKVEKILEECEGTPKELRPHQECAPHVEPDVVPIDAFLKLRAADQMAKIIDEMVDSDTLNARSRLADARLDYGQPHQYEHLKRNNVSPGINPLAHGADERPLGNPNKLKTL
jgi:hypothetical protein